MPAFGLNITLHCALLFIWVFGVFVYLWHGKNPFLAFYLVVFTVFYYVPQALSLVGISHHSDDLPPGFSDFITSCYVFLYGISVLVGYGLSTPLARMGGDGLYSLRAKFEKVTVQSITIAASLFAILVTILSGNLFGQMRGGFDAGALTQLFKAFGSLIFLIPSVLVFWLKSYKAKLSIFLVFLIGAAFFGRRELIGSLSVIGFVIFWDLTRHGWWRLSRVGFIPCFVIFFSAILYVLGFFRAIFYFYIEGQYIHNVSVGYHLSKQWENLFQNLDNLFSPFVERMNYFQPFETLYTLGFLPMGGFHLMDRANELGVDFSQNVYGIIPRLFWSEKPIIGYDTRHIAEIFGYLSENDLTSAVGIGYVAEAGLQLGFYGLIWAVFIGACLRLIETAFLISWACRDYIFAGTMTFIFGHFMMQQSHIAFVPTMIIVSVAVLFCYGLCYLNPSTILNRSKN